MLVKNATKKTDIAENARLCSSLLQKALGLMFSMNRNKCLVLEFCNERIISLHMFFVFYPIDVLFLDKSKIVVGKKENFMPFSFCSSGKKSMYALELPAGTIKKTKTGVGDRIIF